jgi:preprotein translocase subunit SecF
MRLLKLVPDNTNIDFMRWRKLALVLSILATVASLVLVGVKGLNLGVDFVGGQMIRVTFAQPIDVEQLRGRVGGLELGDASIQEAGGPRTYQIRLPKPEGGEAAANRAASRVRALLTEQYAGARVDAVETVSGKVSEELALDGALALGLAMLGVAVYIWFRFEWHFGVGALATLFHDVSVMSGFFALTQLQVDLNIVAAFLAIVGYSLNDTVVIYDRIRENLRKYRKMAIVPLLNLSLNETLSRTIITGVTAVMVLAALAFFGGEALFGFSIALMFGIIIGTYSSIYVGAPIILLWGVKRGSLDDAKPIKLGMASRP